MKKLSLLFLTFLILVSCGNKNENPESSEKIVMHGEIPDITPSGFFYYGENKIDGKNSQKLFLVFDTDKEIKYQHYNATKDKYPTIKSGKWDLKDGIISIDFENEKTIYYLINNDKNIFLLNEDATQQDELNKDNPLLRASQLSVDDVQGIYLKDDDTLKITARQYESEFTVSINSSKNKCNFTGDGRLSFNRIYVELNPINEKLKSQMTITFIDNNAYIFTSKSEDAKDLAKFCSKGNSLIGNYKKK